MKRFLIRVYISFIYVFLLCFYKKKYLSGVLFKRDKLTKGWSLALKSVLPQKILGINRNVPWPCSPNVMVGNPKNIIFDINCIDNFFSNGCYFQAIGEKLYIGNNTIIAPNVGLITSNHDLYDFSKINAKEIFIGDDCWIGMNALILPGVKLGNHTIVGAGAVVTHSFEDGNCVIAGNPAHIIRTLEC